MNTSTRGGVFVSTQAINNARALFPSFHSVKNALHTNRDEVRRVYMVFHPDEGQPRNETRPGSDEGPRSALLFPLVVFIPRPLSLTPRISCALTSQKWDCRRGGAIVLYCCLLLLLLPTPSRHPFQ